MQPKAQYNKPVYNSLEAVQKKLLEISLYHSMLKEITNFDHKNTKCFVFKSFNKTTRKIIDISSSTLLYYHFCFHKGLKYSSFIFISFGIFRRL